MKRTVEHRVSSWKASRVSSVGVSGSRSFRAVLLEPPELVVDD
jgi:hypothetical protein